MLCEIARKVDDDQLKRILALERELGVTIVAFSCRSLEPEREERLRTIMEEFGPQLVAKPAEPDEAQLGRIRAAEAEIGLSLVALRR